MDRKTDGWTEVSIERAGEFFGRMGELAAEPTSEGGHNPAIAIAVMTHATTGERCF
jgi:hypothetical protein